MARTPTRVSERKLVQVGSIWTDGSNDVRVVSVQQFDKYRYITYRYTNKRTKEQPLDDLTFALKFTAKVVRASELPKVESKPSVDSDAGKIKHVSWA